MDSMFIVFGRWAAWLLFWFHGQWWDVYYGKKKWKCWVTHPGRFGRFLNAPRPTGRVCFAFCCCCHFPAFFAAHRVDGNVGKRRAWGQTVAEYYTQTGVEQRLRFSFSLLTGFQIGLVHPLFCWIYACYGIPMFLAFWPFFLENKKNFVKRIEKAR